MANNNYEDYDEIDDAILFKAEKGITYSPLDSPGSVHSPTTNHPALLILQDAALTMG